MRKGDLIIDKCEDPSYNRGLGIIMSKCEGYGFEKNPSWYYVFYFKDSTILAENSINIEVLNEIRSCSN
tara:strand:+ start:1298 stop:1504 length:207 start_codon:yes stop_codon:yes gene_type:complete